MNPQELAGLRRVLYQLLAVGFSHPDERLIGAALGSMVTLDDLGLFSHAYATDVVDLLSVLHESTLDDLSVAYVATFEAGVAGAVCPPHESDHRSNSRTGDVAELRSDLHRAVARYGLTVDTVSGELVDHICNEMAVMGALVDMEATRRLRDRPVRPVLADQQAFLSEHLLVWVPGFAIDVERRAGHPFYGALAEATRSFLAEERQLVPLLEAEATGR